MDALTSLISTVGFPIAVCLIAFWFIYQLQQQTREDRKEESTRHQQEVETLRQSMEQNNAAILAALNANTAAINKLADKYE